MITRRKQKLDEREGKALSGEEKSAAPTIGVQNGDTSQYQALKKQRLRKADSRSSFLSAPLNKEPPQEEPNKIILAQGQQVPIEKEPETQVHNKAEPIQSIAAALGLKTARDESVKFHVDLFLHSLTCLGEVEDTACKSQNCLRMKENIQHAKYCLVYEVCQLCRRMENLHLIHAKKFCDSTSEEPCPVPNCSSIKSGFYVARCKGGKKNAPSSGAVTNAPLSP